MSSTTVQYNRNQREWTAQNGSETKPFPAGTDGKRQAQMWALERDCLDVAEMVTDMIHSGEDKGRAIRAGLLVRDGHVRPPLAFPDDYGSSLNEMGRVQSQSATWDDGKKIEYIVTDQATGLCCDCDDPFDRCKHILAFEIDRDRNTERTPVSAVSRTLNTSIELAEVCQADLDDIINAMKEAQADLNQDQASLVLEQAAPFLTFEEYIQFSIPFPILDIYDEIKHCEFAQEIPF